MISPWLRFGLPMGSALILLSFLESTLAVFYVIIDVGASLALEMDYAISISGPEIVLCLVMIIQLLASFITLWYGVVVKGQKSMMIAWMATTAIAAGIILSLIIYFLVLEFNHYSLISGISVMSLLYSTLFYIIYFAYVLNLGYRSLPMFSTLEEISPAGKGFSNVISYFLSNAQDAAMLAVMSEIVLNTEIFLERQVLRIAFHINVYAYEYQFIGHDNDNPAAILTEEVILRFARIALGCVGFFLIIRGKQQWLLKWCIVYAATIGITVIIFIYLIFAWSGEHVILTLNYYILLLVNLFYRSGVLYVCLRYTEFFARPATHLKDLGKY